MTRAEWDKQMGAWLEWHSRKHWARLQAIYGTKIGVMPKIEISWRIKRAFALAYNYPDEPNRAVIRFAGIFLQDAKNRNAFECEIIQHELCHIAAFRLANDHCHGKQWRECCTMLGIPARLRIDAREYIKKEVEKWPD